MAKKLSATLKYPQLFPCLLTKPALAQASVPEVREYVLRGVIADVEIGLDSDIMSITWGGN